MAAHCAITLVERDQLAPADAVIIAVSHEAFVTAGWGLMTELLRDGTGVVFDLAEGFVKHPLKGGTIVLLHDNHPHAAAVLPELARTCRARGLVFSRVDG